MLRLVSAFGRCAFCALLLGCGSAKPATEPRVVQNIDPPPAIPNLKGLLGLDAWSGAGGVPGSDLSIVKAVLHVLMADPAIKAERVDLDSQGGIVTLSGVVANPLVARRVTAAAERVAGVLGVVDEIQVHPPPRPDHELEEEVRLILRTHTATAARKLDGSVRNGVITLEGNVHSLAEKKLAEEAVLEVTGVRGVKGALKVSSDPPRSDQEIKNAVLQRLRYDARIDARDVSVGVEHSAVRLTGTVKSAAERQWVREGAEVSGATAIDVQKLHVDPSPSSRQGAPRSVPSDTNLALIVQASLDQDPRLRSSELGTFVSAGIVRIHGRVESPAARRAAEQTAANVFGVSQVLNKAQVRPQQRVSDAELQRLLRRRLRAHPDFDATNLEIAVRGSAASLRGTVRNEFERDQAIAAAGTMSGVVNIVDQLRVQMPRPGRNADSQLKREIMTQIAKDQSLHVRDLRVEVLEGVVTLSGRVEDQSAHDQALYAVTRAGARRIVDDLEIGLVSAVDEAIAK